LTTEPVIDRNSVRTAISSISDRIIDSAAAKEDPVSALASLERERELVEEERKLQKE